MGIAIPFAGESLGLPTRALPIDGDPPWQCHLCHRQTLPVAPPSVFFESGFSRSLHLFPPLLSRSLKPFSSRIVMKPRVVHRDDGWKEVMRTPRRQPAISPGVCFCCRWPCHIVRDYPFEEKCFRCSSDGHRQSCLQGHLQP